VAAAVSAFAIAFTYPFVGVLSVWSAVATLKREISSNQ
jgi:hypothetical protein